MDFPIKNQKGFTPHHFLRFKVMRGLLTNKSGAGFTLMEILVYLAVLVILISSVSAFLVWAIRSNAKTKAMREVADSGRRALEEMTYEIKNSDGIYTPTTSLTQLSLETARHLALGEKTGYLDFYLCGGVTLCSKKDSENPIALTSVNVEVNELGFVQVGAGSIQINLRIDFKNPQNRPEHQASINLTSTVSLRSY